MRKVVAEEINSLDGLRQVYNNVSEKKIIYEA